ncbi:MAG: hypothetical protein ACERKV_02125 [Clostridiaceae bacterium]
MNKKIMENRYGIDKFSKFLLLLSVVFIISNKTIIIGVGLLIYSLFRIFSKNTGKRTEEERKFENYISVFKFKYYRIKNRVINYMGKNKKKKKDKNFSVIVCPKCSQKLRVPKHKGKLIVTCSKCSYEFRIKS